VPFEIFENVFSAEILTQDGRVGQYFPAILLSAGDKVSFVAVEVLTDCGSFDKAGNRSVVDCRQCNGNIGICYENSTSSPSNER
jgi:hypothetical protein